MTVALVVLAAGASTRLGACKALVDLGGRTPLERLLEAGRAFDGAPPLVVAGAHQAAIAHAAPPGVEVRENAAWAEGRLGGIALAARARAGCDLCLAPVDVPLVGAAVFAALRAHWDAAGAPAEGWLAPFVVRAGSGRAFGHPLVIGRALAARCANSRKDLPLRELRGQAEPLMSIRVDDAAILDDLDSPDDLERLRRRIS